MRSNIISIIFVFICLYAQAQKISKFNFIGKIPEKIKNRQQYSDLYADFVKRKLKEENPKFDDKILSALSCMIADPTNKKYIGSPKAPKKNIILKYYNALLALNVKEDKPVIRLLNMCLHKSPASGYTRFFILKSLNYVINKPRSNRQIQALFEKLILSRGVSRRDARVAYRLSCEFKNPLFIISLAKKLKNRGNIAPWYKLMLQGDAEIIHARQAATKKLNQEKYLKDAGKNFSEAWKINSNSPETASALITLCSRQQKNTIDDCIEWFKKAISLQFDYYPAYRKMAEAIIHKSGINSELLYNFAGSCIQHGRTDTSVPEYGIQILLDIASQVEHYRWQLVFLKPEICQQLKLYASKKLRLAKSKKSKNTALALQAIIKLYTLNYKNANTTLKILGPEVFDKEIIKIKRRPDNFVLSWNNPRTMIEMFGSRYGQNLIKIQNNFLYGRKAEAVSALTKIIESEHESLSKNERLFMLDLLARMGISQKASLYKRLGSSPLNVGIYYKTNPDFIKKLLQLGIDCTIITPYNRRTALMIAARRNAPPEFVDVFKKAGVDLNQKDRYGWTALQHSIFMNNLPFTKRLLEFAVDTDTIDNTDNPLLLKVLFWKKDKIFDLLLFSGASINICASRNHTLIMRALQQNLELDRLKKILKYNFDLEQQSDHNWTAIYYAICYYNNPEALKLLIEKGAEVNTSDRDGNTPLMIAILWARDLKKIKLLLKHKANVNEKNRAGKTPLIIAAISQNSLDYIKTLVEHGSKLNEADNSKNTAYDWAVKKKKNAISKYLSKHGALPYSKIKK